MSGFPSFDYIPDGNQQERPWTANSFEDLSTTSLEFYDRSSAESTSDGASTPDCQITTVFEGPEKTMEVVFRPDVGHPNGLRALARKQLDHLCKKARCLILHQTSNKYMDSYILSESSLFVYKHKLIMKTCGTTTLLHCLSTLIGYADALGMELTWVGYSRKNLGNPSAQSWPHSSFGDEIKFIDTNEKLQDRLHGTGYILGPVTGDHWFVYVADHPDFSPLHKTIPSYTPLPPSQDRTINLMMFDMARDVAEIFYQRTGLTAKEMTKKSGIDKLCLGAIIDETLFEPCGYSMNALLDKSYFTIHITPEEEGSYVSYETNVRLSNYDALVRNVLTVFGPKRFVLTMFGDQMAIDNMNTLPTDPLEVKLKYGKYKRHSISSTKVDKELNCLMGCYSYDVRSEIKAPKQEDRVQFLLDTPVISTKMKVKRERAHSLC